MYIQTSGLEWTSWDLVGLGVGTSEITYQYLVREARVRAFNFQYKLTAPFCVVECSLSVVGSSVILVLLDTKVVARLGGLWSWRTFSAACPNFSIVRICQPDTRYSAATRLDQRQHDNKPVDLISTTSKWVTQQVSEPVRAMRSAVISRRRCAPTPISQHPRNHGGDANYGGK